ncbi:MAG: glutaminyl-peptide cyclotransferase [Anaerolineaceae bacterium]|nr:MAG: glutaminyl-peptide cyclotransferase [Anaerolineaceae bacterium]
MKRTLSLLALLSLAIILCTSLIGCSPDAWVATDEAADDAVTREPVSSPVGGYGAAARQHIEALTDIGPRVSGTDGEAEAARYIMDAFGQMGYAAELQAFSAETDDGGMINSANVIAIKDGDSTQAIVVGAHYDAVDDGLGSDDNASGVAVMLEVAGLVKDVSTPYTIYFVAFGAEEVGLLGSDAFVSSLSEGDLADIVLMVNLDSVTAGDIAYAYSPEGRAEARDWAMDWAASNGYDLQTVPDINLADDEGGGTGDYEAFDLAGIPWLYFEATNWDLGNQDGYTQVDPQYGDNGAIIHTEYDTLDYLDATFPGRVDERLDLYVAVLFNLLTQFEMP